MSSSIPQNLAEAFHRHREKQRAFAGKVIKRFSYTREFKIAAIKRTETVNPKSENGANYTQYQVAKELGITRHMLAKWVAKKREIISLRKFQKRAGGRKA